MNTPLPEAEVPPRPAEETASSETPPASPTPRCLLEQGRPELCLANCALCQELYVFPSLEDEEG